MSSDHHSEHTPAGDSALARRDFLRVAGYSTLATLALGGCARRGGPADGDVALPYATKPEELTPGRPEHYASVCGGCSAGCGLLVTCRDGRPSKLEGNPQHPLNQGALCAVGQAQVLGVYDTLRLHGPRLDGRDADWPAVDGAVLDGLRAARQQRRPVRVLLDSRHGPSTRWLIERFQRSFPDARTVVCDNLSLAAVAEAHRQTHGARAVPHYRFDRAEVVVAIDCDFLGTWLSPVEFTRAWQAARQLSGERYGYLFCAEPRLSLTGGNADDRLPVAPSALPALLDDLLQRVAARLGQSSNAAPAAPNASLDGLADRLVGARERSLVVCGRNDLACQLLTNALNLMLGGYGHTLDLDGYSYQRCGNDSELLALRGELASGQVGALLIAGVNPVCDLPDGAEWAAVLKQVPLTVSLADRLDETAAACRVVAPESHFLECWGDAEPVNGVVSLQQPTIEPLYATRPLLESCSAWLGEPRPAHEVVRAAWAEVVWPRRRENVDPDTFFEQTLARGFAQVQPQGGAAGRAQAVPVTLPAAPAAGLELVLHPTVSLFDGRFAHNPWLQELPDPVSKIGWDNYAAMAPETARTHGLRDGDEVRLTVGEHSVTLATVIQPGQAVGTVAVALGYGRASTARFANMGPHWVGAQPSVGENGLVGQNAAPLGRWLDGLRTDGATVTVTRTGRRLEVARSQTQDSLDLPPHLAPPGAATRDMVQATTLAAYRRDPQAGAHGEEHERSELWGADHPYTGHHWAMVIDLNACTGCSACVVSCQVENNIPAVGKDELRRRRELHWLRLDRYYQQRGERLDVAWQPMLCHHCDNAPCEVVCPVLATVHSAEGLNQQVYNRCVGTRYCANNCPYKVRRFNWFNYPHDDATEDLVLNPEVTVRTRGVMEKCTFCVQRIETAKMEAAREGRPLADGDIQPACAQSCPARAILFGDRNDPNSAVARALQDPRRYQVLAELGVEPAVNYLRIVRNRPDAGEEPHHG